MAGKPKADLDQTARIELEPADPFELIRWLARSQPDPRKATAELIQNSLDAGAQRVDVVRARVGAAISLSIRDDGEGVLPHLQRRAALEHLAKHVGHSHKMSLDPGERARRVVAGQYGVGLLGFWAIGHRMEIHSRVGGGKVAVLRLTEDSPHAEVGTYTAPKGAPGTYTEVSVSEVHESAARALSGRRLADYLAVELRGQLLRSGVALTINDRLARGAARELRVVPHRYSGEKLELPAEVPVRGFRAAHVELYLARGFDGASIELSCAGTRVADDLARLDALGLTESPWTGAELTGVIDFPDFSIPPGTRRGVLPNAAALAFLEAMGGLAPRILAELERLDLLQRAELDRQVVHELRRALRGFDERVRDLTLPPIAARDGEPATGPVGAGEPVAGGGRRPPATNGDPPDVGAGPLAAVTVLPGFVRITPATQKLVRAVAKDAEGRALQGVAFEWRMPDAEDAGLAIEPQGHRLLLTAGDEAPLGRQLPLMVVATLDGDTAADIAAVAVVEAKHEVYARLGIPEPLLVSAPGAPWRSRRRGFSWEINEAHPDYQRVKDQSRRRLRYLIALLAKEIVISSTRRDDAADLLEAMVQVLAHAEGNLR